MEKPSRKSVNELKQEREISYKEIKKEKPVNYYYENYPYMPAEIEIEAEVSMMIMQIREEILEKSIERAFNKYFDSQIIPFTVHCIKQSLRRIINWMYLVKEDQEVDITWKAGPEPHPAPIDGFCSGVVPNLDEGFQAVFMDKVPKVDDIDRSLGSISSLSYALQEEVHSKKKKKKTVKSKTLVSIETEKTPSPLPSVSMSYKSKSIYSKSMGFNETRSQRHKYVRQLANYIHPKNFQRNLVKAQYKVQAQEPEQKKDKKRKTTTITVKDTEPETLNL